MGCDCFHTSVTDDIDTAISSISSCHCDDCAMTDCAPLQTIPFVLASLPMLCKRHVTGLLRPHRGTGGWLMVAVLAHGWTVAMATEPLSVCPAAYPAFGPRPTSIVGANQIAHSRVPEIDACCTVRIHGHKQRIQK